MKFLRNLVTIVVIIAIVLVIGWAYLGGFIKPVAQEAQMGPYIVAYTTFTGDYKDVGPTMKKLYEALSGAGIHSQTGIGIYYDAPGSVSGQNLRSDVGSVIAMQDFEKLERKSPDYKLKTIPQGNRVVVEFPYKNSLSYIVGPMKVYPVMNEYMQTKGYNMQVPRIEIYDMGSGRVYYMADIVK